MSTMTPEQDIDTSPSYFLRNPWTATILSDPYLTLRPLSWNEAGEAGETFFGRAVNTLSTIPRFCMFVPTQATTKSGPGSDSDAGEIKTTSLLAMVQLGLDVANDRGVCHTGVITSILDEVMGTLGCIYNGKKPIVTASLDVEFCGELLVGSLVVVRARVESAEGRKTFVVAEVEGGEGGAGAGENRESGGEVGVCARARALFITLREKR